VGAGQGLMHRPDGLNGMKVLDSWALWYRFRPRYRAFEHGRIAAFISIPKNASKTVLKVLQLGRNRDEENTDSLVIYENHQRGAILRAKYRLDDLFVFCFSRNPYDRCVSWFEYHHHLEPYRSLTFDQWVRNGMPHHWRRQNQTHYSRRRLTPLLQYTFVEGCRVDFIGRMEDFARDLRFVVDRLNEISEARGLEPRFSAADYVENTSRRRHDDYSAYYTPETRNIVFRLLRKDFEHFGYEK